MSASLAPGDPEAQHAAAGSRFGQTAPPAQYATGYAKFGWPTFQCASDAKVPLRSGGFHNATTDQAVVERQWQEHPRANVALRTGPEFWVLDVDPKNGGDAALQALLDRHGPLPDTLRARTPSGGEHIYFAADSRARNTESKLGAGLDTRGHGGYVLAEGSTVGGRRYGFLDFDPLEDDPPLLAPAPGWLIKQAFGSGREEKKRGTDDKIRSGQRNKHLSDFAFALRKKGFSIEGIEAALRAENDARCDPPLDESEVRDIAQGKARIEPDKSGTESDPELLDLSQLAKSEPEAPRFIVYPWLPENGPVLCAGHGGTSKSQLMLMLAVCIALELAFFGHACERRKVLFYSAEDSRDVLHWRLANICRALDVDLAALDGWLFIFDATAAESICYTDAADLGDRLTPRYRWLAAQIARHEIGVAFIDGVADVFDASENDRSKVKAFVRACMALVKPQRGSVVLIGHVNRPTAASPKSAEGYAGTTGWHNAVRARWYLRTEVAEDGQPESGACAPRILELQKSNYSPAGATLRLLWDAGKQVYTADVPEPAGGVVEAIRARTERRMILTLLTQCEAIGRNVAVSEKANSNAGVILGEREGFPASFRGRDGRKRLFRLLRQLEEDGRLRAETLTTASRNRVDVWRLTDAGKKELAT